jgi:glycosyltransferase involved in cell wall biosynthesis
MNILMTNHRLHSRGGSEVFTSEVARALAAKGNNVCVFTTVSGGIGSELEGAGIPIVADPALCPFQPDIIHGQHHVETMTALASWPSVPVVHFAHGLEAWEEQRPKHPRIQRYIAMSPRLAEWIALDVGQPLEAIAVVKNFIDEKRFKTVRDPALKTGKALVYINSMKSGSAAHAALQAACADVGLTLDARGIDFGEVVADAEALLPNYDLVFASGKSAIEAMACGCTVIPISKDKFRERIHPGNVEAVSEFNFCTDANDPDIQHGPVADELRRVQWSDAAGVCEFIRSRFTLDRAADQLLKIYETAVHDFRMKPSQPAPEASEKAFAKFLLWMAGAVKDVDERHAVLWEKKEAAVERADKWKLKSEALQKKVDELRKELEAERRGVLAKLFRKVPKPPR